MSTGVSWLPTSKDYKLTSEKNCLLKNACTECKYFMGKFDAVLATACSTNVVGIEYGNILFRESTGEVMYVLSDKEDINFKGFPLTVCDRPTNSIMFIKELKSA